MTEGELPKLTRDLAPNLTPEEWHDKITELLELLVCRDRRAQCREALLDGKRVVVLGLLTHQAAGEVFEPVAVLLDSYIAQRLQVGDHGPWFPRKIPDEIWL